MKRSRLNIEIPHFKNCTCYFIKKTAKGVKSLLEPFENEITQSSRQVDALCPGSPTVVP